MPPIFRESLLRTVGRAPGPIQAVVLHSYFSGLDMLDNEMDRCPRPRPTQSPGCHTSFHYGIASNGFHQYVLQANTAWGFGVIPQSCPEPICAPTPCESCTGLTVDQYNPDLDGNAPTLPAWAVGADGTVNNRVLHVAFAMGAWNEFCCEQFLQNQVTYRNLVASLWFIFDESGLVPSQNTLLVHCGELDCLDIDQLVTDILDYEPPAPVVPCECVSGAEGEDALALSFVGGELQGSIILDPDPDNILSQGVDGLLALPSGSPAPQVAAINAFPATFNPNTAPQNRLLVTTSAPGDTLTLTTPTGGVIEIWIKNLGVEDLDVATSGAELIDGVASIKLAGTDPGNFPFGNNGGDSVQLLWNGTGWFVL